MDFEAYKQRLRDYVSQQLSQVGSLDAFARAIALKSDSDRPLSREAIRAWANGSINEPIRQRSLEQLAAYRGETVEQTRAWLEGAQEEPATLPKLTHLMTIAPLSEVAHAIAVGIERLQNTPISGVILYKDLEILKITYQALSEEFSATMCSRVLRRIIGREVNLRDPAEIERFKSQHGWTNPIEEARIDALLRGDNVECDDILITAVAFSLYQYTGKEEYSAESLKMEIKNAPDREDQERPCFLDDGL